MGNIHFEEVGNIADFENAFERMKAFKRTAKGARGKKFKYVFPYFKDWKNRFKELHRAIDKMENDCIVLLVCRPIGLSRFNRDSSFSALEEIEDSRRRGSLWDPFSSNRIGNEPGDGVTDAVGARALVELSPDDALHCFLLIIDKCGEIANIKLANLGATVAKNYATFFDPTARWYVVGTGCGACQAVATQAPTYNEPEYETLGPNSNTYCAQVMKKCGLKDPFKSTFTNAPTGWTTDVPNAFP